MKIPKDFTNTAAFWWSVGASFVIGIMAYFNDLQYNWTFWIGPITGYAVLRLVFQNISMNEERTWIGVACASVLGQLFLPDWVWLPTVAGLAVIAMMRLIEWLQASRSKS